MGAQPDFALTHGYSDYGLKPCLMLENKMQDGSMKFKSKFTSCELFTVGFLLWLSSVNSVSDPILFAFKMKCLGRFGIFVFHFRVVLHVGPIFLLDPSHSYPLFSVLAQIHFIYSDAHCSIDQCLMSLLNY